MSEAECLDASIAAWLRCRADLTCWRSARWASPTPPRRRRSCAALFGGPAAWWAGPGTGLDRHGVAHKAAVVERGADPPRRGVPRSARGAAPRSAAARSPPSPAPSWRRARAAIPVLLDGFVAGAAAALLHALAPERSTTPRRRTARPSPATPACSSASGSARCSSSTCAWARPRAPRSRSCSAAPRSPATPAWRPSPRPASAIGAEATRR